MTTVWLRVKFGLVNDVIIDFNKSIEIKLDKKSPKWNLTSAEQG